MEKDIYGKGDKSHDKNLCTLCAYKPSFLMFHYSTSSTCNQSLQFESTYTPSKIDNYRRKVTVNDSPCEIDILDTGGQEDYVRIKDNYFIGGEGFLCVFSIVERESFAAMNDHREQILRVKQTKKVPMILVGNKVDLEQRREVSQQEAESLAQSWGVNYIETSAKTCVNVEKAYTTLLTEIIKSKQSIDEQLIKKTPKKQNKCCVLL